MTGNATHRGETGFIHYFQGSYQIYIYDIEKGEDNEGQETLIIQKYLFGKCAFIKRIPSI